MNAPQNSKSLFAFICNQMEKLDNGTATVEQAKAQANFAKQANNVMKYELDRVNSEMKIIAFNKENSTDIKMRSIESKLFDNAAE
jgi:hypothetical protein